MVAGVWQNFAKSCEKVAQKKLSTKLLILFTFLKDSLKTLNSVESGSFFTLSVRLEKAVTSTAVLRLIGTYLKSRNTKLRPNFVFVQTVTGTVFPLKDRKLDLHLNHRVLTPPPSSRRH